MLPPPVDAAAAALADDLLVDEERDLVTWVGPGGELRRTGLHDYAALYAVPGLYEAVYGLVLQAQSPALLASLLVDTVDLRELTVLDVGCGTGALGSALLAAEAPARLVGIDLEPAVVVAVPRDRPGTYGQVRALDLCALSDEQRAWLEELAPDVVTCVAAVGFGHLPLEAFEVLTGLLRPGGLLAVTVARDLRDDPALAGHAALLLGASYRPRAARDGVHRVTADGRPLHVTALVLERA